jgi:hypothetical protein
MTSAANATRDWRKFTELAVVMARASGILFHVQGFGISLKTESIRFSFLERTDAGD